MSDTEWRKLERLAFLLKRGSESDLAEIARLIGRDRNTEQSYTFARTPSSNVADREGEKSFAMLTWWKKIKRRTVG
ncbi:MAG: hypothetical protein HY242_08350 [Afipia sp.]|nr:hypothetical protein [Afipia sp.]